MTTEGWVRAQRDYAAAAARDPREARFGYLAADPATGAVGALVWFPSLVELFAFLAGPEIDVLAFDEADARRMAVSVQRMTRGVGSLARVDREGLSACFEGWSEIVWLGSFAELCERGGPFATEMRAMFRRDGGTGDHAGPIADDELDAFVEWLRACGQ